MALSPAKPVDQLAAGFFYAAEYFTFMYFGFFLFFYRITVENITITGALSLLLFNPANCWPIFIRKNKRLESLYRLLRVWV